MPGKSEYSEGEAAAELGVSIEDLRELVRTQITEHEQDLANMAILSFRPADLLLLRMLAERRIVQ